MQQLKCCLIIKNNYPILVAGPRLALGSQGYEPCELLLLHPAMPRIIALFDFFANYGILVEMSAYIIMRS